MSKNKYLTLTRPSRLVLKQLPQDPTSANLKISKKLDFLSTIVEQKSLAKLIIVFLGISNKLITLLAKFLFSLLKRLHMVIIQLKDIEIFLGMN